MKYLYVFYVYLIAVNSIFSQEICNNAIDDDNDGLIDLNDADCVCTSYNIIPNPSFEEYSCCPTWYSEMYCLNGWTQASSNGTTDYLNSCGFYQYDSIPAAPTPYPDGNGFIGFIGSAPNYDLVYKEYAEICLNEELKQGRSYEISFFIGFGGLSTIGVSSYSELEISVFGNTECNEAAYIGDDCPLGEEASNYEYWEELTKKMITGENEWIEVKMNFSPSTNTNSICIGPSCDFTSNEYSYFFIDKVSLENLTERIRLLSGNPCTGDAVIGLNAMDSTITYQWYKEGIALLGETSNKLEIAEGPEGTGIYQLMIDNGFECKLTKQFELESDYLATAKLSIDSIECGVPFIELGRENYGNNYLWNTGDTTKTIEVTTPGYYSVTVSNFCNDADTSILITDGICDIEAPNIFSPIDEATSGFRVLTNCCMKNFNLKIYSRYGAKIFESDDINTSWDGTLNNLVLPSDVYIWVANYELEMYGELKCFQKSGDLTLIR